MEAGERMRLDRRDDAGLDVRGRAQVERHAARDQLAAQLRVVDRARAVGDPLGLDLERPPDLRRAAPLAGVDGDPQAAGAGHLERPRVEERIREGLLAVRRGPSRSGPRRGTWRPPRPGRRSRPGRASGGRSQMSRTVDPRPVRRRARPAAHRRDPVGERETARRRGAAGPSGSRRSGRCRPPCPRRAPRRSARAPRRPASGRSAGRRRGGARPGRGKAPARRARRASRRASSGRRRPRVRASSSAVSIRSEPSRWRWSSAFGIDGEERSETGLPPCPDATMPGHERGTSVASRSPSCGRRHRRDLSLGAAGIVGGDGPPAGDAVTRRADVRRRRGDRAAASTRPRTTSPPSPPTSSGSASSGAGRSVPSSRAMSTRSTRAVADGRIAVGARSRPSRPSSATGSRPARASGRATSSSSSPDTRRRHAIGAQAPPTATDGLDDAWSRLATGSIAATRITVLLEDHDKVTGEAAAFGADAASTPRRSPSSTSRTRSSPSRGGSATQLARTVDVSTLTQWLDLNAEYDAALRRLYEGGRRLEGQGHPGGPRRVRRREGSAATGCRATRGPSSIILAEIGAGRAEPGGHRRSRRPAASSRPAVDRLPDGGSAEPGTEPAACVQRRDPAPGPRRVREYTPPTDVLSRPLRRLPTPTRRFRSVQLRVVTDQPWDVKADVLAVPIVGEPAFDGPLGELDRRTGGELAALAAFGELRAKRFTRRSRRPASCRPAAS